MVKKKKWVVIITAMIVFLAVIYNKFNRQETPAVITEQIITGTLGYIITTVGAAGVIQPTSQQLLDEATFGVKKSQTRIKSLKADIKQNEHILRNEEVSLSYAQIYSPIAGVVTAIHVDPRQTLNVNQQTPVLMQIADLKNMTVYAKVSEADINQTVLGQKASFRTYGTNRHIWHDNVKKSFRILSLFYIAVGFSFYSFLLASLSACFITVVFGVYPSHRAAASAPIEGIREL
nr:efflux RND transporter periplasmic adaptor subunit [Photorhabdus stackebrandtii]